MKKLVLTAIILMGFAMGSYAQQYYPYYYGTRKGGLFYRGSTQEQQMREWFFVFTWPRQLGQLEFRS